MDKTVNITEMAKFFPDPDGEFEPDYSQITISGPIKRNVHPDDWETEQELDDRIEQMSKEDPFWRRG